MNFEKRQKDKLYKDLLTLQTIFSHWNPSVQLEDSTLRLGVELSEKISLSFRNLCVFYKIDPMDIVKEALSIQTTVKPEGWLKLTIPLLLPKKKINTE